MELVQRSLQGGILIVVIVAIRVLWLDRLPKRTFPVLWCVVLVRLLAPFSVSSGASVYSFLQRAQRAADAALPGIPENVTVKSDPTIWQTVQELTLGQETALAGLTEQGRQMQMLPVIWCIGAVFCGILFLASYLRCLRGFRRSVPVENGEVRQWLHRHRTGRFITVRQSEGISAPLTYGIFRPVILLPGRVVWGSGQELAYILQHEYVHICHWDGAVKLAMVAALCLHWFNPLVWAMCRLMNRDLELACDEGVLRRFGEEARAGYAMTLIGMEEKKHVLLPLYNGFSKNAIEERVSLIMKYKKIKHGAIIVSLMLVACMALVFATSARTAQAESGQDGGAEDQAYGSGAESLPMDPPSGTAATDDRDEDNGIINRAASGEGSGREAQPEDGRKLEQLALAFWEAYLAGDAAELAQYLSADYGGGVETFPDGLDGHVAAQAQLLAVKGLDGAGPLDEDNVIISMEFRPAADADYLEYLTISAVKEGDGWKVAGYGLEL